MRVAVAMSGGVDSSTAAAILKKQGHEVIGVTMKLWDNGSGCCSIEDIYDAKRIAAHLKIPHYTLNLKKDFEKEVVNYFANEYSIGRTPNPCVVCNKKIKFDILLQRVKEFGAEYLATGHYAKIENNSKRFILKRGKDNDKDQSYFLGMIPQETLSKILFPLGNYTKTKVRRLASRLQLKVAKKVASQEVCFVPDDDYAEFIGRRHALKEGPIVDKHDRVLGYHNGIVNYTIGQRKRINKPRDKPFYVTKIDAESNTIWVGDEQDLYSDHLVVEGLNWFIPEPDDKIQAEVQIRYNHKPVEAVVIPENRKTVVVKFKNPERAITPGQLAVFYDNDMVIGSGWIK